MTFPFTMQSLSILSQQDKFDNVAFNLSISYILMGSWIVGGKKYIQLIKLLYCKPLTCGKKLPAFPLEVRVGFKL